MSFFGSSFSFDGTSCEEYGLMMYDFNNATQGDSEYASGRSVIEDRIANRIQPFFYHVDNSKPLEFTLVFGKGQEDSSADRPIDRQEMEVVAKWLLKNDGYKKLVIDQPDMESYWYNCIITDLKTVEYSGKKWAFSCHVICDSPYAYRRTRVFNFVASDSNKEFKIFNSSSINNYYYPEHIVIQMNNAHNLSIKNKSDSNREFKFDGLTSPNAKIIIDNNLGVISCDNESNIYDKFNFHFLRLIQGVNTLDINGDCSISITCSFPVNIGG